MGAEGDAVRVAGWLHDVGYAPSLVATGFHPVDGARFLRAQGARELVVSLVAHHSGAVFEAEQRGLAGELAEFAAPPQELLDVVTYADLTTSPDGAAVTVDQRLSEIALIGLWFGYYTFHWPNPGPAGAAFDVIALLGAWVALLGVLGLERFRRRRAREGG